MSVQKFVNDKLAKLDEEHKQYVKESYYLHAEYTNNEYEEMISEIEEKMMRPPKSTDEFTTTEMLRTAWVNDCKREIESIRRDMKRAEDYRMYRQQKEVELDRYPKSNDGVIRNLRDYINEKINYYHKDLVDSYFDMFVDKVQKICPKDKDYTRTIGSVYQNKNSKKAMGILTKFFDTMRNELLKLSLNVKGVQSDLYFTMEQLLKSQFLKLIERVHTIIYDFIQMKIDYIDEEDEMSDSRAVKVYAENCMCQLNEMLMKELPVLLDEEFKIAIEDRIEDLSYRWKEQIGYEFGKSQKMIEQERTTVVEINDKSLVAEVIEKPEEVKEVSIDSFIETLPNDEIEINELVEMYNNYFGTTKTAVGFGKLKDIKDRFTKKIVRKSQKKITYYQKL